MAEFRIQIFLHFQKEMYLLKAFDWLQNLSFWLHNMLTSISVQ